MKPKKLLQVLLPTLFLALLLPLALFPGAAQADDTTLYVSATGNDASGDGSEAKPYATLAKTAEVINNGASGQTYLIKVMDDLTMTAGARYYNNHVTVTSADPANPVTLTRGAGFATQSDVARGWYNPALFEIDKQPDVYTGQASLRIEAITLDDANRHEGTLFEQQSSSGNLTRVQDAMIATYQHDCSITLGPNTTLQHMGGLSAIRATGGAKATLENGALLKDMTWQGEKKPAKGVIWLQSAHLDMQTGAAIENTVGSNAILADAAKGSNTEVTMAGRIAGVARGHGLHAINVAAATISGEITGLSTGSNNALNFAGTKGEITADGHIHDNRVWYGGVYLRDGSYLTIRGKINSNTASEGAGGLCIITNGAASHAVLEEGGQINQNISSDFRKGVVGGVDIQQGNCSLTMNGGQINGNSGIAAGAVLVRKGETAFIMNGGEIAGNSAWLESGVFVYDGKAKADLNSGAVQSAGIYQPEFGKIANAHVYLGEALTLTTNPYIAMSSGNIPFGFKVDQTVGPLPGHAPIQFGNPHRNGVAALAAEATALNWGPLQNKLWLQKTDTPHFSVSKMRAFNPDAAVYALIQATNEDGTPVAGAPVEKFPAVFDGNRIHVILPEKGNAFGYTVAIAQPKETVTVTFDLQGGEADPAIDPVKVEKGDALGPAMPTTVPVKAGHTFLGWNTKADGSGDAFDKDTVVNADMTVYAQWKKKSSGGSGGGGGGGGPIVTPPGTDPETPENPPVLNKEDHFAYMYGYPDGTFMPDRAMTRAEVAAMFSRLLVDRPVPGQTYPAPFSDVAPDAWYSNIVGFMHRNGVLRGYPDGTFQPDAPVSRAEFAAIASRFDRLTAGDTHTFSDVPDDHWAASVINFAATKGWVGGYPDGTFMPDRNTSRAEVIKITNLMLERYADEAFIDEHRAELVPFSDLDPKYWAYYTITEATNGHDYVRKADGKHEIWSALNHKNH